MTALLAIPRTAQRDEPWANGAGTTTVVLREPDDGDWHTRVSIAFVAAEGPFSDLPGTRRVLVPLDAPMTLRFDDGREESGARMGVLRFNGAPAPTGLLPDGSTRDFNLMLRNHARGEVWPRTLVDSMVLPHADGDRWLVYLASGEAELRCSDGESLALQPGDAALLAGSVAPTALHAIRGAGEIILVKLYA